MVSTLSLCVALIASLVIVHAAPSANWEFDSRSASTDAITLTFAIKQQNVAALESTLRAVSDPKSSRYGQFMTSDQVNNLVKPAQESIDSVLHWLSGMNIDLTNAKHTSTYDMLSVPMTIAQAEALLNARYFRFRHVESGAIAVRCLKFSLPDSVSAHIDTVGPTTRFPLRSFVQRNSIKTTPSASCDDGTTPDCLRSLYQVGNYSGSSKNSTSSVNGFLEQYISPSDLQTFFTQFDPSSAGRTAVIVGPNDASNPGTEASLDIQYSMGLGHGINANTFWYTAGRAPNNTENEPFLAWLLDLANTPNAPVVISTSYGDDEPTVDQDYANRVNVEFMKAGVRGISLFFSSGDSGVGGSGQCSAFVPTFPAISPYVTSVGATYNYGPEVGVEFSSGGFGNYFAQAWYQTDAINGYFNKYGKNFPSSKLYNASGRGFPDVSANGVNFPIVQGGQIFGVDGTSCSSPTFAAIISLIVDARYVAGKGSLGFLNPVFYQNPSVLNDITSGNNPGCGTNGFYASTGWDPVTGLGTPNFPSLLKLALSLP